MKNLFAFVHRRRRPILFLVLAALALALLLRPSDPDSRLAPVRAAVLELFGPFQQGLEKGFRFCSGAWERYLFLVNLSEENRMLREIVQEQRKEITDLAEERLENRRLRALLGFRRTVPRPLLPAQVVGKDVSGWFHTLTIDRGRQDGIEQGMAVLSVQGLVGQVMETSANFSRVLLITDPNSAVAAVVQRTRARGIAEGRGVKGCVLKYVHRSEDVAPGDPVLASGLDGVYPRGSVIGTVVRVRRKETELFQEVEVYPSADFNKLEEVLVLCEKLQPEPPAPMEEAAP